MIGELLDHYRVLELVGCGAMGVVYKALDINLDRSVAIKVMGAEARNDPAFVERFRQEARLQGALAHPNIAVLFDYFVHEGAPVAVMEFIDGESLEQLIRRRGPIPAHECMPIFRQALLGVAAAHRAGIIHRDLKPSNLMVTKDGIVKVMDFGIAKRQGVTGATKVGSSTSIGSPLYMAPEQILGRAVDCRTDVYALGVTLYELLCGEKPFNPRGKTEYSVLNAHVNELPEPPTVYCRDIPGPVVDVVLRALNKEPDARFQSADEFIHALPDLATPSAAAPDAAPPPVPTKTVVLERPPSAPTKTVVLERPPPIPTKTVVLERPPSVPTKTVVLERPPSVPTKTVVLEHPPPMPGEAAAKPGGTMVFEYVPPASPSPQDSMAFEYSAATLARPLSPRRSAASSAVTASSAAPASGAPAATLTATRQSDTATSWSPAPAVQGSPAAPAGFPQVLKAGGATIAAVLVALLVRGTLMRHAERLRETARSATIDSSDSRSTLARAPAATQTQTSTDPAAPPSAASSSSSTTAAPAAPSADVTAATTAPAPPDLSGTWRGEYIDASGKQLLRVVSLSIRHVRDDGGIEGTLQYEAASGDGECKLHARGSNYSAGAHRLQLSPEGCTPHHPKELGVPLNFDGVNPEANTLGDGRIEAPTGEVIRVNLQRVSGV